MKILIADAVIIENNKVLLVQQRKASAYGLWGLPGGHIEPGETPKAAVLREIQEELGLRLQQCVPLGVFRERVEEGTLEMHTFTGAISGAISIPEDELMAYEWVDIGSLPELESTLRNPVIKLQIAAAISS